MLYGEQIRAARGLLGWTQTELANRAGVSQMTVMRLESKDGIVGGTVETVLRVQEALETGRYHIHRARLAGRARCSIT